MGLGKTTRAVNLGLRARLSAIVFVVIGLVTLPMLYGGIALLKRQARAETERQLVATNRLVRDLIASHYDTIYNEVVRLGETLRASFPGRITRLPAADGDARDLAHEGVPLSSAVSAIQPFAQRTGTIVIAAHVRVGERSFRRISSPPRGPNGGQNGGVIELYPRVVETLQAGSVWTGRMRVEGVPRLVRLMPVAAPDGELIGVFLVGIDLAREFDELKQHLAAFSIGATGYIFVIDMEAGPDYGRFVVHPVKQGTNLLVDGDEAGRAIALAMLERREGVFAYDWRNEERGETATRHKFAAFAPLDRLEWLIGVSVYEDEYASSAETLSAALVAALLVMAVLVIFALNVAIGGWVINPMLRLQRTLRTLSRGNEVLVHSVSEQRLTEGICRTLVETGGFPFARIAVVGARGEPCGAASAGSAAIFEAGLVVGGQLTADPADEARREGRILHFPELPEDRPALRSACAAAGCRALIVFPLLDRQRVVGVLTIGASETGDLDPAGVALLQELAEDLAFGIASQRTALARQAAEAALDLRERAIEASSDGVFIVDAAVPGQPLIYANPAMGRLIGCEGAALAGRPLATLDAFSRESLAALIAAVRLARGQDLELDGVLPSGGSFWCQCSLAPVAPTDAGHPSAVVIGVVKDVTERIQYLRQIEHQAKYDALTGLPNRALLDDRLAQAIIAARRHDRRIAVAFVDLDHFKLVNDNLGHRQGDRLLREVAARLADALRDGDTAARQGGDEFVIVLPDLADERESYEILSRVRDALARPIDIDGRSFVVTCSIGVSVGPKDGDDADTLLRDADIAMYHAKAAGRDAIRFYIEGMNEQVRERVALEQALRCAVANEELHVFYQPQVEASGRICGAEALLRWQHAELGAVSPSRFIPVAEELGLIGRIGEWVLREACRQARAWHDGGMPLRIAVNVSARQLDEDDLPERVAAILAESGLPPGLLELELTESMLMGHTARGGAMLQRLKAIGVRISLDDFGTGYSSFAYLQHLPIDTLKIDQSFVREIDGGSSPASIVGAIIAMAHGLGIGVVAEGVETARQRELLLERGCDVLQGYYFGRPVPPAQFGAAPSGTAPTAGLDTVSGTG